MGSTTPAATQALRAGQTVSDTLTVTSKDGTATHAIVATITGANDAAVISGTASGTVMEDGNLSTGGILSVADVDASENAFKAVIAADLQKAYGTFSFDAATGAWGFSLDNAAAQALKAGEQVEQTLTVESLDGTDQQIITVTIAGANDAPTVAGSLAASQAEGTGSVTIDLLQGASDEDAGETATLSVTQISYSVDGAPASAATPAGVRLSGTALTVDPAHVAFDHLAVGQQQIILVDYTVIDGHTGGMVTQTATITITGTNDVPVVAGALTAVLSEGSAVFTSDLLQGASDKDVGETATLSITQVTYSVDGGAHRQQLRPA